MKLLVLCLLPFSAWAIDPAVLKPLVIPYPSMTDAQVVTVLTTPAKHIAATWWITYRDAYDALGMTKGEQFITMMKTNAPRFDGWLDSTSCGMGLNIGASSAFRAWANAAVTAYPSLSPLFSPVLGLAESTTTPLQDAGIMDTITAADVTAARALP